MVRISALLLLLVACGGGKPNVSSALDAYADALERRDYQAAYALMSEMYRAQHTFEQFKGDLRNSDGEVKATVKRLRRDQRSVEMYAEFNYGLGESMRLVREGDGWKIATNPANFYSQASPREALRSFVRAYQGRRWKVMLRYVPKRYRDRMDVAKMKEQFDGERREEMAEMMNSIAAHLDQPITVEGQEARMSYAERFEVRFQREPDGWKIADLD